LWPTVTTVGLALLAGMFVTRNYDPCKYGSDFFGFCAIQKPLFVLAGSGFALLLSFAILMLLKLKHIAYRRWVTVIIIFTIFLLSYYLYFSQAYRLEQ